MTQILVEWGDDATFFWPASTDEERAKSSIAILKNKLDFGYYYSESDEDYADVKRVVEENDLSFVTYRTGRTEPLAWKLVENRCDHEYENVTIEHLQEV
jgi:hypothetical protein